MGNWFSSVWDRLFGQQRELKLVIVGLDSAGKSTIINRMRLDQLGAASQVIDPMATVPTIGVNTEDITIKNVNIKVFDLAGQEKMRSVWKYYFSSIDGIVFVVDASGDQTKLADARDELMSVLANDEAKNIPVMILANKQDLPKALKS
jgi:ADP-ribosylation factor 1/2